MTKNIFLIAFLGLLLLACGGSGGTGGDGIGGGKVDGKGGDISGGKVDDGSNTPEQEKPKVLSKADAKAQGSFIYYEKGEPRSWLDGTTTHEKDGKAVEDKRLAAGSNKPGIQFTGQGNFGSRIYFSTKDATIANFYDSYDAKTHTFSDSYSSQSYQGGKYLALNNDYRADHDKAYSFFEIALGYFLIPFHFEASFGYFNRSNDGTNNINKNDLVGSYSGKAWSFNKTGYENSEYRVEGTFKLTIASTVNFLDNILEFDFSNSTESLFNDVVGAKIINLNFNSPDRYKSGFFQNAASSRYSVTLKLKGDTPEKPNTTWPDSIRPLRMLFAGPNSEYVGGKFRYSYKGLGDTGSGNAMFFAGCNNKTGLDSKGKCTGSLSE